VRALALAPRIFPRLRTTRCRGRQARARPQPRPEGRRPTRA
jgi:hypothetical protein